MATRSEGLVDQTALDGARIDVGTRIGWLLRTSRVHGGLSLREMAGAISADGPAVSFSTLSRLEAHGQRVGSLVDGYERALGLAVGQLRSPVDMLCRTFDYAPSDTDQPDGPPDLDLFSSAVDAVSGEGHVATGGDWLRFARLHSRPAGFGLPRRAMEPLVGRLASELSRAVAPAAYTCRYEALARLRCSPYAGVVEEAVRDFITAGSPVVSDVLSALTERPSATALAWFGELLVSGTPQQFRGAALAVQNVRSVGGLPEEAWAAFVPQFLAAYEDPDEGRRLLLTRLYKALSPGVRRAVLAGLSHELASVPGPREWTRTRRNVHYAWVESVVEPLGTLVPGDREMLTRLVFEVLFDFRATRAATASYLLNASPYADAVQSAMQVAATDAPDATTRDMAQEALLALVPPRDPATARAWVAGPDPDLALVGHVLLGHAGVHAPDELVVAAVTGGGPLARSTVYAAGMAGHPVLRVLREDPAVPVEQRRGADWFVREGSRVTC